MHPKGRLGRSVSVKSVTKRFGQFVSSFLALSFALAGLVAISPTLHVAIEHGGHGPTHTHLGGPTVANSATASPAHLHLHPHPLEFDDATANEGFTASLRPRLFVSNHQSFSLLRIPVQRWWQAFARLLDPTGTAGHESQDTPPDGNGPGHQHHSLPQLMAGGLLDAHIDLPGLPFIGDLAARRSLPSDTLLFVRDWYAQTASRGPPFARS